MAYKIYQKLKSGMAALGLIDSTDIDTAYDHKTNGVVDRKMTQEEMNALFNQGKGLDGQGQEVQLGKTYKAGTGLSLTPSASGDEFSLDAATTSSIGGIQLSSAPESYAEGNTSFPVVGVSGASTAKVEVPMANTNHSGLMSKALFDKLSALPTNDNLTIELGNKEDKITLSSQQTSSGIASITANDKTLYTFALADTITSLTVTLPAVESGKLMYVGLFFKTAASGTFQSVSIYKNSTDSSIGNPLPLDSYEINANCIYEVSCVFNGISWVIGSAYVSSTSPSSFNQSANS